MLLTISCLCSSIFSMNLTRSLRKNTILMFIFWITVIVTSTFTARFHAEISLFNSQLLIIVFTYAATYIWFIEDAKELGLAPSKALTIGVIISGSICVPYYLLRYKGFKRSLYSLGKFVGLFVGSATLLGTIPI
jgi:hypothetical protein